MKRNKIEKSESCDTRYLWRGRFESQTKWSEILDKSGFKGSHSPPDNVWILRSENNKETVKCMLVFHSSDTLPIEEGLVPNGFNSLGIVTLGGSRLPEYLLHAEFDETDRLPGFPTVLTKAFKTSRSGPIYEFSIFVDKAGLNIEQVKSIFHHITTEWKKAVKELESKEKLMASDPRIGKRTGYNRSLLDEERRKKWPFLYKAVAEGWSDSEKFEAMIADFARHPLAKKDDNLIKVLKQEGRTAAKLYSSTDKKMAPLRGKKWTNNSIDILVMDNWFKADIYKMNNEELEDYLKNHFRTKAKLLTPALVKRLASKGFTFLREPGPHAREWRPENGLQGEDEASGSDELKVLIVLDEDQSSAK